MAVGSIQAFLLACSRLGKSHPISNEAKSEWRHQPHTNSSRLSYTSVRVDSPWIHHRFTILSGLFLARTCHLFLPEIPAPSCTSVTQDSPLLPSGCQPGHSRHPDDIGDPSCHGRREQDQLVGALLLKQHALVRRLGENQDRRRWRTAADEGVFTTTGAEGRTKASGKRQRVQKRPRQVGDWSRKANPPTA